MGRVAIYTTFDLKPGADPKTLEALGPLMKSRFLSVDGCVDSLILIGMQTTEEEFSTDRVGQYT